MTNNEPVQCPFCGQEFDDSVEEGIHRAEKHVQPGPIYREKEDDVDEENSLLHQLQKTK